MLCYVIQLQNVEGLLLKRLQTYRLISALLNVKADLHCSLEQHPAYSHFYHSIVKHPACSCPVSSASVELCVFVCVSLPEEAKAEIC